MVVVIYFILDQYTAAVFNFKLTSAEEVFVQSSSPSL